MTVLSVIEDTLEETWRNCGMGQLRRLLSCPSPQLSSQPTPVAVRTLHKRGDQPLREFAQVSAVSAYHFV